MLGEVIEGLRFGAFVHADDTPAHVIVDRGLLAGIPDERHDAVAPVGRDMKDVLRVAIGRAFACGSGEHIGLDHQLGEPQADRFDKARLIVAMPLMQDGEVADE